ncbi:MAG: hypothetical protein A3F92_14355 [Candidatus Rokubacteria bacterium RIFCSPLOWO2_12_FULL_71_22]|nr:MAG: hypothetical protein A3F92_14355 [Candidatus Rokubacteria bacterium RIFCSPLOWO2_12_FULL_71_22]
MEHPMKEDSAMSLMMTRRASLITLAGLVGGFVAGGSLGAGSVSAQSPTQTEIKAKGRAAVEKGQVKWESLTPEQQEAMKTRAKGDMQKAQAQWQSMTPEQQQEMLSAGKAAAQRGRKKWQALPK